MGDFFFVVIVKSDGIPRQFTGYVLKITPCQHNFPFFVDLGGNVANKSCFVVRCLKFKHILFGFNVYSGQYRRLGFAVYGAGHYF